MENEKPRHWNVGDFLLNMLATLFGVMIAFWLTEWANDRDFKKKERHLLQEVHHELGLNLTDLKLNLQGHNNALYSARFFRNLLKGQTSGMDSATIHYVNVLRDFTSIQHTAAYETLKSRGVESVTNDSLRINIADLYDFDFEAIQKIEEDYSPHEFFTHYNEPVLQSLAKCFDFAAKDPANGRIMPMTALPNHEKNMLIMRFKKLQYDRQFSIEHYKEVIQKVEKTIKEIETELAKT